MRFWRWLMVPTRRPYFVIAAALVVVGTGVIVAIQHQNTVERRQRNDAIRLQSKADTKARILALKVLNTANVKAVNIGYKNQLASCNRGISIRSALRKDALAIRKNARAEYKFFTTAIRRAEAQSKDPVVSSATRASAVSALKIYGDLQDSLPTQLTVPPVPKKCVDIIVNPNVFARPDLP